MLDPKGAYMDLLTENAALKAKLEAAMGLADAGDELNRACHKGDEPTSIDRVNWAWECFDKALAAWRAANDLPAGK